MKVLLVNCVFGYGSTGKIINDIVDGLSGSEISSIVAYGRGITKVDAGIDAIKLAPEWIMRLQSLLSKITGLSYDCSPFSTNALFRLIEREKPDIVNLHCINANTVNLSSTISYLKEHHIKTVLTIHAEFPYTGGCGHAYDCEQWKYGCKKCAQFKAVDSQLPVSFLFNKVSQQWRQLNDAYKDFNELTIVCVSKWLASRASQSPFYKDKTILTINNGLNIDVFRPRNSERLKSFHNLYGKKIILHVTPDFYSSLKGGKYVLELARRMEKERPDYRIVICGYNGDGSDLPSNVIPVNFTKNQEELAEYYSMADVTLLTSKRETFSMVVAESLSCGTPVIGFEAGGPESIAIAKNSIFIPYGQIAELYDKIVKLVESGEYDNVDIEKAESLYSLQRMAKDYRKLYEDLC